MKKKISFGLVIVLSIAFSCQTEDQNAPSGIVSEAALSQIKGLGFNAQNVQRLEDGAYLVEGDIVLHDNDFERGINKSTLRVAQAQQYRTTNLVSTPRLIKVSVAST